VVVVVVVAVVVVVVVVAVVVVVVVVAVVVVVVVVTTMEMTTKAAAKLSPFCACNADCTASRIATSVTLEAVSNNCALTGSSTPAGTEIK
jgi:hypothetical protein